MPDISDDFYQNLRGFDDFPSVTDLSLYSPLPDDWCIVVADIKGSTKAIGEGRGEFNRSSQHSGIGGCYDGTQTAVGSVWTEQVAFARSTGLGTA